MTLGLPAAIILQVVRKSRKGSVFSQPGIRVLDAIRTIGAAGAGFEEGIKGSLSPGKLADMILEIHSSLKVNVIVLPEQRGGLPALGAAPTIPKSRTV